MFNLHRFIHKYPFETLHEMNLDWLIESVKELAKELEQYEIVNSISYGGEWDITKQYKSWTIVAVNGTEGYISIQPVPAGIDYTNADYWRLVADFTVQLAGLAQRVTDLETEVPLIHQEISNNTWLDGKKVVWYGDSWGTTTDNVVGKFIAKYPNVDVTNRCIGGTTMTRLNEGDFPGYGSNSGYQRIRQDDLAGFDYIFIMYGANDWQTSRPLRNNDDDEYCFNHALRETLTYLLTNYPALKPVYIFQSYCYHAFSTSNTDGVNYQGVNLPAYINNGIDICKELGVEYINLYTNTPVNAKNYTTFIRNDSGVYVHPLANLSEIIADTIFEGKKNTGKCYGDEWSANLFPVQLQETENIIEQTDYTTPTSKLGPCKVVTVNDSHSLIGIEMPGDELIVHIQGYSRSASTTGFYVDNMNGGVNTRTGLFNIAREGYIDCYVHVSRSEYIGFAITTSGTSYIMSGIDIRIMGGASDLYSSKTGESATTSITLQSNPVCINHNGTITIPHIQFDVTAAISPYSQLIRYVAPTYHNYSRYIIGYDASNQSFVTFYHYNDTIRNAQTLQTGHTYIIPGYTYDAPQ